MALVTFEPFYCTALTSHRGPLGGLDGVVEGGDYRPLAACLHELRGRLDLGAHAVGREAAAAGDREGALIEISAVAVLPA